MYKQKEYRHNVRKDLREIIKNAPKDPQDLTEDEILKRRLDRIEKRKLKEQEEKERKLLEEAKIIQEREIEENKENEKMQESNRLEEIPEEETPFEKPKTREPTPSATTKKPKKKKKKESSDGTAKKKKRKKVKNDDDEDSLSPLMAGSTGLPTFYFNAIEKSVSVFQKQEAQKKFYFKRVSNEPNLLDQPI